MRGVLLPATLLWLALAGCKTDGGADAGGPPAAEPPVEAATLLACPRDDLLWERAITEARRSGTLDELRATIDAAAAGCADRWEPPWAAGEALYAGNRKPPPESFEAMRVLWQRALERAGSVDDPVGIARAANRLGSYYKSLPDFPAAESMIRRSLAAARRSGRDDLMAFAYNNLAGAYRSQARLAEAIEALGQATEHLELAGRRDEARAYAYNRSTLLEDVGQLSEQRRVLERTYEEAVRAGDDRLTQLIHVAMGNHHLLLGELEHAREWFERVPEVSGQAPNAALGLGRVALRERRLDEAAGFLDRASAAELHPVFALFGRTFRAEVELRRGATTEARSRLEGIIGDADAHRLNDMAAASRTLYGKTLIDDGARLDEAIDYFRAALRIVEGAGAGLNPSREGMTYLRERSEPFAELAAALARRDAEAGAEEVLQVVERSHARALRQILGGAGPADRAASLAGLQEMLGEGELLLDFLIGQERGTLIALTHAELGVALVPGWNELRPLLRRWGLALKRPLVSAEARRDPERDLRRDVDAGLELRRRLLGAVEPMIGQARRIYVVPDQDLALLPFAALPRRGSAAADEPLRFLGEAVEVAVLPMAGVPAAVHDPGTPLLLAGDPLPDPGGEFTALPLARSELDALAELWSERPTKRLSGPRLRTEELLALPLQSFGTLHFATHAVASSRDPQRCAVILSEGQRLSMLDIAELRLGPSLVVLSACRTGEGEVIPGEGVVGLTWAFLSAGARGVVASLWNIEDRATTELMVAFHRNLRAADDPVTALSRAQRELARTRRHPVYWAPFVIVLRSSL